MGILFAPVLDSGMYLPELFFLARALGSGQRFFVVTIPAPAQFFGITRGCGLFAPQVNTGDPFASGQLCFNFYGDVEIPPAPTILTERSRAKGKGCQSVAIPDTVSGAVEMHLPVTPAGVTGIERHPAQ